MTRLLVAMSRAIQLASGAEATPMPMLMEPPSIVRTYVAYLPAMAGGSKWGKSSRHSESFGRHSRQGPVSVSGFVRIAVAAICGAATFTRCRAVGEGPWLLSGGVRIPEAAGFGPRRGGR